MKTTSLLAAWTAVCLFGSALPARADWDTLLEDAEKLSTQTKDMGAQAWEYAQRKAGKLADMFSDAAESSLVGRFYDLKHPIDGKAQPLRRQQVVDLFHDFNNKKWNPAIFSAYYSPNVKLYAPYFYLPRCKASYGPKAFQCNEKNADGSPVVEPTAWVVVYCGVVTAPKSGTFRFVGMGDDTLMVRFDNKLVLESGWSIPTRRYFDQGTHQSYQQEITQKAPSPNSRNQREITPKTKGRPIYQYETTPHWNERLGGIPGGVTFTVKKGEKYPIEILVSEIPGNEFGYCLLLEEVDDPKKPSYGIFSPKESPILHLFRTNNSLPEPESIREALTADGENHTVNDCREGPPFLQDSLIWEADFAEAEKQGLIERLFGRLTGDNKDTAMGTSRKDSAPQAPQKPQKDSKDQKEEGILDSWRLW